MELLNLTQYQTRSSKALVKARSLIRKIVDESYDFCSRDSSGNYTYHNEKCPTNRPENSENSCPFDNQDRYEDDLQWIETAPFLSCYFRNPAGAQSQTTLTGFKANKFKHYYRYKQYSITNAIVLKWFRNIGCRNGCYQPQIRDLKLGGLYEETAWDISRFFYVFVGIVLIVIIGGKLIWRSWDIVFGAGSFCVAVPMLFLAAITYHDR